MRKTKKNSKRTKAEENPSQKKERRGRKNKTYEVFYFILFYFFIFNYKVLTYNTYLLTNNIWYLRY